MGEPVPKFGVLLKDRYAVGDFTKNWLAHPFLGGFTARIVPEFLPEALKEYELFDRTTELDVLHRLIKRCASFSPYCITRDEFEGMERVRFKQLWQETENYFLQIEYQLRHPSELAGSELKEIREYRDEKMAEATGYKYWDELEENLSEWLENGEGDEMLPSAEELTGQIGFSAIDFSKRLDLVNLYYLWPYSGFQDDQAGLIAVDTADFDAYTYHLFVAQAAVDHTPGAVVAMWPK